MPQDGKPRCRVRRVDCRGFPRSVPVHMHSRQERICIRVKLLKDGRGIEPVNEERRAAGAVRMREEVKDLQAAGVCL